MSGKTPVKLSKSSGVPGKVVAAMGKGTPKRTAMSMGMKPTSMVKGLK